MKLNDGYVVKNIVGNVVVIPIGQMLVNGVENIVLDTEGAFFIRHILAGKNEDEITDLYADLFSEDIDDAIEKYNRFIEYALENGFLDNNNGGVDK